MVDSSPDEIKFIYDDYEHLDSRLLYTVTRIISSDTIESGVDIFEKGCTCVERSCTSESSCTCLKYGVNYRLTEDNEIVLDESKFGNVPVFECNFRCSCFGGLEELDTPISDRIEPNRTRGICSNRNVQFGPVKCLELFDAGSKGLGLKSKRKISRGSFICEYAGEVIGLEEAIRRQNHRTEMNYVFVLKEYAGQSLSSVTCVDPSLIGNIGRYINHSCQPNAAVVPVRVNDSIPWLCVFAIRDIEANEEICYDYSGNENAMNENIERNRKPCLCREPNCRKFLPFQADI
ncbi:hypothetical protein RUM44_000823 [Polyplax serrata]|uniref:Histone-lysine N-methyltransferase set-23 n=1 Tax=Polyplax serrata TaxID=468196 RepID=A0ABR1B686_POLSC